MWAGPAVDGAGVDASVNGAEPGGRAWPGRSRGPLDWFIQEGPIWFAILSVGQTCLRRMN